MLKKDMQVGPIPSNKEAYGNSLRIAIPAVIEMVSISLMDMIDTVMVGRVGSQAMAAVGLTGQPRMLILSIFFALNIALTAIIARKKGEGDLPAARNCLSHGLLINIVLGLKLTMLAIIFARPLMGLAGAQPDTIHLATSYFRITNVVLIFQIMTMTICVAQRAIGNTKVALRVNVTAKVVSVILNFLLIEGRLGFPRLEVDGVAYARSIAAVVAFGLALLSVLHKESPLRLRLQDFLKAENFKKAFIVLGRFFRSLFMFVYRNPLTRELGLNKNSKEYTSMGDRIGKQTANGMLEQISVRFGFFAYARIVADLGTNEFAAHVIAMQLMVLSFTFADGIGAATTSLVGQNLGKNRPDLSSIYGKIGMRLAIICAAALSTFCILFRYQFAGLFSTDPWIISTAGGLILILAVILPIQTSQLVMGGSLRGAGDTKYVALTMLIAVGVMRPLLGFIMVIPLGWGLTGAWVAMIFDQAARLFMLFNRFRSGKWMKVKV